MADAAAEAGGSKKRPAEAQLTREGAAAETKNEAAPVLAAAAPGAATSFPSTSITAPGPSPFSAFAAAAAAGGGFGGFKAAASSGGGFGGGFGAPAAGEAAPAVVPVFGGGGGRGGGGFGAAAAAGGGDDDEEGEDAEADADEPPQPEFKPVCTLPEAPRVTGEEEETNLFSAQATLFAFEAPAAPAASAAAADAASPRPDAATWRERGRGEVRCNVRAAGAGGDEATPAGARVLMRAGGHLRLILNAALYSGMVVSVMDGGKGVSFACVNTVDAAGASADTDKSKEGPPAGKGGMKSFAVRLRGADAEERTVAFKAALEDALSRLPAKGAAHKAAVGDTEAKETAAAPAGEEAV